MKVILSIKVEEKDADQIREYCKITGKTISAFGRKALTDALAADFTGSVQEAATYLDELGLGTGNSASSDVDKNQNCTKSKSDDNNDDESESLSAFDNLFK